MAGIIGIWLYFLGYMIKSFRLSPRLDAYSYCDPSLVSGRTTAALEKSNAYPLVSVILPARNEETYISSCLTSLLAQDYPNCEVIAINDCSSDSTADLIRKYSIQDKRVKYVEAKSKPQDW